MEKRTALCGRESNRGICYLGRAKSVLDEGTKRTGGLIPIKEAPPICESELTAGVAPPAWVPLSDLGSKLKETGQPPRARSREATIRWDIGASLDPSSGSWQ